MTKKVPKRSPASKSKAQHPVRTVRKKRAAQKIGSAPEMPTTPRAVAIQRLRDIASRATASKARPFSFFGESPPLSEEMSYHLALVKALSEMSSPERVAERRKYWADLRAEEERQVKEELERVMSQLSLDTRRRSTELLRTYCSDDSQRLRMANALLATEGIPRRPRIEILKSFLADNDESRMRPLQRLAGRFNAGRPSDDERWALAKRAWLEAHKRGSPHRAVPDAMAASGLSQSAVYERKKRENWRAEGSR